MDVGLQNEALEAIRKAVDIYQKLIVLPRSAPLNNLFLCLSNIGLQEEALEAIRKAVEIYWKLAADRLAAFGPDLAMSLNNLSLCLSNIGH